MTIALVTPPARAANVREITSPSGIVAWLVEDYTVPVVSMNVAFLGGSAQDPDGKPGVANLLSGLLDEGAGTLDSRAFQGELKDLSIDLSFDSGRDAFYGNLRTLSLNLDRAFELFRLAINEPRFDAEAMGRIRGQVSASLRHQASEPGAMINRLWAETMFGGHPYGRPGDGTLESVAAITADDLKRFHARTMARSNLHVVIVGAIDEPTAAAALDQIFGALPTSAELAAVAEIVPTTGGHGHAMLAVPQTAIRMGGPGLKRDDPDFITAFVADQILGGGTFSSRLYKSVREDRGLAYSVGSGLLPYDRSGIFVAATSVDAANAESTIALMREEIGRFAADGPNEAELAAAKDYLIGNFALRFDSSQKIARNLLNYQVEGLGIDYLERRNTLIRAVTIDDIRRVARRIWSQDLTVVTVGPGAT